MLHVLRVRRHEHLHVVLGLAIAALAVDEDLVHLPAVEVADRPLDQAAFLVDRRGRDRLQRQLADLLPLAQQVLVVALDLGLGPRRAGGADDQPRALGHGDRGRDLLQLLAVRRVGDLAGDAAAARGVRHQHAVAAGEAQVGGQRRALVAALLLDDLHQQDLADLEDLLDLVAALAHRLARRALLLDVVAADRLVLVLGRRRRRSLRPRRRRRRRRRRARPPPPARPRARRARGSRCRRPRPTAAARPRARCRRGLALGDDGLADDDGVLGRAPRRAGRACGCANGRGRASASRGSPPPRPRGRARPPRGAAPRGRPWGSGSSRGGSPRRRGSRGGCRRNR